MIGVARPAVTLMMVSIAFMAGAPPPAPGQSPRLPATVAGWTRADSVGVYAGKNLFLLIDGGADLFYEYGFVRAFSSEYSRSPDTSATVELYEMESPVAAYGLFTSFTAGTGKPVARPCALRPAGHAGQSGSVRGSTRNPGSDYHP